MKGKRISREAALRIGAVAIAVIAAIAILPGLLSPPEPPPLAADIGLGTTGPSGAAGAVPRQPDADDGEKRSERRKPDPSPADPPRPGGVQENPKEHRTDGKPAGRRRDDDRQRDGKPSPAPPPAPQPAPPPPAAPAPAPAPLPAPAPVPQPPPPTAPGDFGP